MRRGLVPAGLALTLAACGLTDTGTRARDVAAGEGARAYDEGLANAEFFICRAVMAAPPKRPRPGASSAMAAPRPRSR